MTIFYIILGIIAAVMITASIVITSKAGEKDNISNYDNIEE